MSTAAVGALRGRPATASAVAMGLGAWSIAAVLVLTGNEGWIGHDAGAGRTDTRSAAALFVGGWALMIGAVMVPTTTAIASVFDRMIHVRRDRAALGGLLLTGYATTWLAAGTAAYGVDEILHLVDDRAGVLSQNGWVVPAVALALAGGYQFSSLKGRCLSRCRSPFAFVASRWSGRSPRRDALRIGIDHGRFCVGCCWALMLVMTALSSLGILWMVLTGSVMVAEKTTRNGTRLVRPAGFIGLTLAVGLAVNATLVD